jgi:hypothetical protein
MLEILVASLLIVRNALYFITGGWLFFIAAVSLPKAQKHMLSKTEVIVFVFCCFVVWCWLFSKLITL